MCALPTWKHVVFWISETKHPGTDLIMMLFKVFQRGTLENGSYFLLKSSCSLPV